jgi:hypothetical protein
MEIEVQFCGEQGPRMIHIPDYKSTLGMDTIVPRTNFELLNTNEKSLEDSGTLRDSRGLYEVDPFTCDEWTFLQFLENASIEQLEKFGKSLSKTGFYHSFFYLKHDGTVGNGDRFIEDVP